MTRKAATFWLLLFYLLLRVYGGAEDAPNAPVTLAVVVYESEIGKGLTFAESEVLNGKTSQALRTSKRWRQYDKDHLPAGLEVLKEQATKGQTDKARWMPWLFLFHGKSTTWNGAVPTPETKFSEVIQGQGGI